MFYFGELKMGNHAAHGNGMHKWGLLSRLKRGYMKYATSFKNRLSIQESGVDSFFTVLS